MVSKFTLLTCACLIYCANTFAMSNDSFRNDIDPTALHYSVYSQSVPDILIDESQIESRNTFVEFTNFSFRIAAGAPKLRSDLTDRMPVANVPDYPHLVTQKTEHEQLEVMKVIEAGEKSIQYQSKPYKAQRIMTSRSIVLERNRLADHYTYPSSGTPIEVRSNIAKLFPLDSIYGLSFSNMISIILTYDRVTQASKVNQYGQVIHSKEKQRTIGGYSVQEMSSVKLKGAKQFHVHVNGVYLDKSDGKTRVAADFKLFNRFRGTSLEDYTEQNSIQTLSINTPSEYVFY